MASEGQQQTTAGTSGAKMRNWAPRIWAGINMTGWFKLLVRNRFDVSLSRVAMVVILAGLSVMNSFLWLVQMLIYGRKIARTKIEHHPVFIIGHWRAGTTLLHELMTLDPRHTYPNTYACFAPNHFLVSKVLFPWWLRFLLPARRPMDNMAVGWERPQEDEFALCNMGIPSPYLQFAFPNRPPQCEEYLDLKGISPKALARWKRAFVWFLKCVTVKRPGRIVLKSPQHTCRIDVLLELFPDARFVHIVRDPYVVFPSTVKTWKRFYKDQGAQVPTFEGLEEFILARLNRMYRVFESTRDLVDPSRFAEVHYEDLVKDPVGQMRDVYERLELGEFDKVLPALEEYAAGMAGYQTNRYTLAPEVREEITRRWEAYIRKYGYGQ